MTNLRDDCEAILITGPTASGKSALAMQLARKHRGVVINADSMQVYDTLRVLTARPSEEEMGGIDHRLYGHVPARNAYSTGDWLRDVEQLLPVLRQEGRLPVFVGGTGLYFKALTGGLSEMPAIPADIRDRWRSRLVAEGAEPLHAALAEVDPVMARRLRPSDGQRIVRALEVMEASGRSIGELQEHKGPMLIDPQRAEKIIVLPDRRLLHERINRRFGLMLDGGAIAEVTALRQLDLPPAAPVLRAIGVAEIGAMLTGNMERKTVIERGSALTRQYAKRQMTWFRNQMDDSWVRLDPFGGN
ncbi:tRNA (adenosine(37)-N6)-dimethylallyltransferase MiaA [Rhizobium sp. 0TCS1.26]